MKTWIAVTDQAKIRSDKDSNTIEKSSESKHEESDISSDDSTSDVDYSSDDSVPNMASSGYNIDLNTVAQRQLIALLILMKVFVD